MYTLARPVVVPAGPAQLGGAGAGPARTMYFRVEKRRTNVVVHINHTNSIILVDFEVDFECYVLYTLPDS